MQGNEERLRRNPPKSRPHSAKGIFSYEEFGKFLWIASFIKENHLGVGAGKILYGNFSTISVFVPLIYFIDFITKFTASLCIIKFVLQDCLSALVELIKVKPHFQNSIMPGRGGRVLTAPSPHKFPLCHPRSLTLVVLFHPVTGHWGISILMDENHPDCDDDRKHNPD